jgi:hypothetical protein
MQLKTDDNGFRYFESLEAVKPEFTPIPVRNLLQFYTLQGKKSILCKDNLCPIPDLSYLVKAKDDLYYLKDFRNYDLDTLYFYYDDTHGLTDEAVEALRMYVYDNNVWLLFTPEMVDSTKVMLARVYKAQFGQEGTIKLRLYLEILEQNLRLEAYKRLGQLIGYKTVQKQFEDTINNLWREAIK